MSFIEIWKFSKKNTLTIAEIMMMSERREAEISLQMFNLQF